MQAYDFTVDWVTSHVPHWWQLFGHLRDRPDVAFLEIGAYEGRATIWLLENILTHTTASIDCVDLFEDQSYTRRFDRNVASASASARVRKLKGRSQEVLRGLKLEHYDAVYVDGSHVAADVLEDAVLSFRLLKRQGVMLFDDYEWYEEGDVLWEPKAAIDAFLEIYARQYELVHHAYQVAVRKL